jgi:hypothetical protein
MMDTQRLRRTAVEINKEMYALQRDEMAKAQYFTVDLAKSTGFTALMSKHNLVWLLIKLFDRDGKADYGC